VKNPKQEHQIPVIKRAKKSLKDNGDEKQEPVSEFNSYRDRGGDEFEIAATQHNRGRVRRGVRGSNLLGRGNHRFASLELFFGVFHGPLVGPLVVRFTPVDVGGFLPCAGRLRQKGQP